jgi:hypothetical protein
MVTYDSNNINGAETINFKFLKYLNWIVKYKLLTLCKYSLCKLILCKF